MSTDLFGAIQAGAARPVAIPPGEIGASFVRRLFDAAANQWNPREQYYFRLVRSTCQCANDAANHGQHQEAEKWISLAESISTALAGNAARTALSCIRFNESYLHFARKDYRASLSNLEMAIAADRPQGGESRPGVAIDHLNFLHHLHLKGRVLSAAGDIPGAVKSLAEALIFAAGLPKTEGQEISELVDFSCSRVAGELSIIATLAADPGQYLRESKVLDQAPLSGSATEYPIFHQAYESMHNDHDCGGMADLVRSGRRRTICWYSAVVALASQLRPAERSSLTVQSSTWRDMPSVLRSRLLEMIELP